ncbi:MAG: hypothetical protein ACE5E6_08425 [Phycisphaerae bacterium]
MVRRFDAIMRKAAPFAAAGMLLQMTGCDTTGALDALTTTIVASIINSFVFSFFGVPF